MLNEKNSFAETINRLSEKMIELDTGSLAQLRRMDVDGPGESAFWELVAECDLREPEKWMQLIKIMAILTPKGSPSIRKTLHNKNNPFGEVLAKTEYPELRLLRFISMPLENRGEAMERIARWLARKNTEGINCIDIACLLFSDDVKHTRRLAETFYRKAIKLKTNKKEEN